MMNDLVQKARVNLQSDGASTASIRLNPRTLGQMTLNLQVQQNQVHAQVIVESEAARKLVQNELEHLRQELRAQGVNVESVAIRVREPQSAGQMSQQQGGDQQQQPGMQSGGAGADRGRNASGDEHPEAAASEGAGPEAFAAEAGEQYESHAGRSPASAGGVNIRV